MLYIFKKPRAYSFIGVSQRKEAIYQSQCRETDLCHTDKMVQKEPLLGKWGWARVVGTK